MARTARLLLSMDPSVAPFLNFMSGPSLVSLPNCGPGAPTATRCPKSTRPLPIQHRSPTLLKGSMISTISFLHSYIKSFRHRSTLLTLYSSCILCISHKRLRFSLRHHVLPAHVSCQGLSVVPSFGSHHYATASSLHFCLNTHLT